METIVEQFDHLISDLDNSLASTVKKHELEYLKGYQIYVREKERELRELVLKLN